jgi:cation transport regulator ChaB
MKHFLNAQTKTQSQLIISINDPAPEERREWLTAAITNSLRWYASNSDRRDEDDQHAIVLIDFLQELQTKSA